MSAIFGQVWWDYMMIGVTKWKYSQAAIDEREDACNDYGEDSEFCVSEEKFIKEFSQQLEEKMGLIQNFTFAFMDSFSQSGNSNLNDEVQQMHWQEETRKLWVEATRRNDSLEFKTIDEVLEENQLCKEENQRLHDIIEDNITALFDGLHDLTDTVTTLDTRVEQNEIHISQNEDDIANMESVPVGTIIAWTDSMSNLYKSQSINSTRAAGIERISLPEGWLPCDGTHIEKPSVWAGMRTPNLNDGDYGFLRGGSHSEVLLTEEDSFKSHDHYYRDYFFGNCGFDGGEHIGSSNWNVCNSGCDADPMCKTYHWSSDTGSSETRPKNTKVLYIMKVF